MTDIAYRYNFEVSQLKERVQTLEKLLENEREQRIQLENELLELKNSQQSLPEDEHEEYNEN